MPWQEWVGFLAFGLNLAGNWMLTAKDRRGWWIRIWSNVAQLAYALLVWSPYLVLNSVTFGGINVHGIIVWRRMEGHTDRCGVAKNLPCNCGRLA
jgi:hypothetical protein